MWFCPLSLKIGLLVVNAKKFYRTPAPLEHFNLLNIDVNSRY